MSVVNRMLLDIDRRHGAAEVQSRGPYPDIRSVAPGATPRGRSGMAIAALIAAAVVIAAALHFAGVFSRSDAPPAKSPVPVAVRAAPPAARAVPPTTPAVPLAAPTPPAAAPALPSVVAEPEPRAVVMSAPLAPEREPAAVPPKPRKPPAAIESFKLSRQLSPVEERPLPPAAPAAQPALRGAAVSSPAVKSAPPLRAGAADETVAAARVLWNEGSRTGALATLRDALAAAEGARNPAAVTPIARELARLEVADNRPQVALDLLRRFEGPLADDAEAWALRGNAEQRLALHADSARSYLSALRMRPAEGRWMLGAAISLAADGQADEAQAWAERARERGAVTPAMETYLQQLGLAARR